MTSRFIIRSLVLVAVAGVSFGVTTAARQQSNNSVESVPEQLSLPREQWEAIQSHDATFGADLATLRGEARARRQDLCAALESSDISDGDIRAKAASLRDAENRVQERVLDHLLAIRQHLTPDQQRRLLNMCAQGMRQGRGGGMRWGPQDGSGPGRGGGGPYRGGGRGGPRE